MEQTGARQPASQPRNDVPAPIATSYVLKHEAKRIIEAIEPARGATMTLMCALAEAWKAGRDGKELVW